MSQLETIILQFSFCINLNLHLNHSSPFQVHLFALGCSTDMSVKSRVQVHEKVKIKETDQVLCVSIKMDLDLVMFLQCCRAN